MTSPDSLTASAPPSSNPLDPQRLDVAMRTLRAVAGDGAQFREDQLRAVAELTRTDGGASPRALVVQRTGWGKSAVYWAATAIRRGEGFGPTLVVSPLLSLMRDQVAAASSAGLRAATINSSNIGQWSEIERALGNDELDLVLVSPERLANPSFGSRVMDRLAGRLGLLVIDEAHAVSDWGHDFRPDYRRVAEVLRQLNPATPVLATTATANRRVTDDVAGQLGEATLVLRGPLARESLQLSVVSSLTPIQRYAWVVDHLPKLAGSGIVYVLTVADAERLAQAIREVHGEDYPVAAYTGKQDSDVRHRLEDRLRGNQLKALVATSALGMGYDKPDLGFVIHVGSPPSPVSYYQQVGRAGRAIEHASVVLLPSPADEGVWDYFATATIPDPAQMTTLLKALNAHEPNGHRAPMSVPALEAETGLRRTKVELMVKQLAVDKVVERTPDGWLGTGRAWSYDAEHYDGVLAVRRREAEIMRAYTRGERCLMELLAGSLDDPSAAPCGRCSVCLNRLPAPLEEEADVETMRRISKLLRSRSEVLDPRKMWPGGEFGARGRIPAGLMAEAGRVLIHADAPEWTSAWAAARNGDGAAMAEITDACVLTLVSWRHDWSSRPEIVVTMPSTAGATPIADAVTERLATVGRLSRGRLGLVDGAQPLESAAAGPAEAAWWRGSLLLPEDLQVAGRPVLLALEESSSTWPLTVAAAMLREAGASVVLPLLIHRSV